MHDLRRTLPSLTALVAFEAAARHGGFTRAAEELGVTQTAVSRRIAALEAEIGQRLFDRRNRRVFLTEAGQTLFATVGRAFGDLAGTIAALRDPDRKLTVAVSVAFAHFRLLPLLSSFRATVPDVDLRVISGDLPAGPPDPQIDLSVRYGKPPFRGMRVLGSVRDRVVPVCAPALAAQFGAVDLAALATRTDIPRIDSAAVEASWLTWATWLRRAGWPGRVPPARLRFSSYSDAAYAAMAGEGVALGWITLLERPLADGRLVALPVPPLIPEERHHILIPDHRPPSAEAEAFAAWLTGTPDPAR